MIFIKSMGTKDKTTKKGASGRRKKKNYYGEKRIKKNVERKEDFSE